MQKRVEYFSNGDWVQLIPGLPDDVALHCLLRLPVSCRAVCKRWNAVLGNKERFFSLRNQLGFKDPWLFLIASPQHSNKIQCHLLDLANTSWHTIPPMPPPHHEVIISHSLKCVSIHHEDEDVLFIWGGGCDLVSKFEIRKNQWTAMDRMSSVRSDFACGSINGMIYVAGGADVNDRLCDSAEVFDPAKGSWHPIATIGRPTFCVESEVLDGKLHSWSHHPCPRASFRLQVYDPTTNNWEMSSVAGLTEAWRCRTAVVYGHLFVLFGDGIGQEKKIKVFKPDNDSWEQVQGRPPLENLISKQDFVVDVCGNDGTLCVVTENLDVTVGYVTLNRNQTGNSSSSSSSFSVRWQQIPAPIRLSNYLIPQTCHLLFA